MRDSVFLDTSFSIALSVATDELHQRALELTKQISNGKTRLITTQAVILEIGNALSKLKYRQFFVKIIEHWEADPNVMIVPLTNELCTKAFELFRSRLDKEWGLVDSTSFVVMQERKITDALTADEHYTQAGFRALLREK